MIVNAAVTPLWPEDPEQRQDRLNFRLVNSECLLFTLNPGIFLLKSPLLTTSPITEYWNAAIDDQSIAICALPRLCAQATEKNIMTQILNLDFKFLALQPHPHHFLHDPDLHFNHDLCELDTHNLVQYAMRHLLHRGLDIPASILLTMDKKYGRFDFDKMGPFHFTLRRSTMGMLVANGFDVNEVHRDYRDTALLSAVKRVDDDECVGVVRRLLDHGADMEIVDAVEGHTAVTLAARENKTETTKLLLRRGAQVSAQYQPLVRRVASGKFTSKYQGEWNFRIYKSSPRNTDTGYLGEYNVALKFAYAVAIIRNKHDSNGASSLRE